MSYTLEAVVAGYPLLQRAAAEDQGPVRAVPLAQGLGLVPCTEAVIDGLAAPAAPFAPPAPGLPEKPFAELWRLSWAVAGWCKALSADGPVAYVEADIFGGTGTQASVVWKGGAVVLGPLSTPFNLHARPRDLAINRALRRLGVERGGAMDEFDALDLGRHRDTERWLPEGV